MNLLTGKIVQALCWMLIHSLWQGLLMAVLTGIVMIATKKSGSVIRYRLLSGIFLVFISGAVITFYIQLQGTPGAVQQQAVNIPAAINTVVPSQPLGGTAYTPAATGSNTLQDYVRNFEEYFNTHASLIVTIWFIIFMARCVKILSGIVHLQRIRHYKTSPVPGFWQQRISILAKRLNIRRPVFLLESALIKVPAVVGFLKPTILVPIGLLNNLSQEEAESILMHELAHIWRKDYLFNLLQCFVDVIFFFNPAVLWVSSLIRNERENCCDDIAIIETKSKKQFVQALVSFHQYNNATPKYAMPFAERKSKLVDRVKRIVNNNNTTLNPAEKIVLVGCLIVFGLALVTVSNGQAEKKKAPQHKAASATEQQDTSRPGKQPQKIAGVGDKNTQAEMNNNAESNNDDNGDFDINYKALGYTNISVDKLIELREHGVSASFIRDLKNAGYKDISLDDAIALKDHGVNIEFIKELNNAGFKNITMAKVTEARDHGVGANFLHELSGAGFTNITLDKAIELRDHGVNLAFVKELNSLGFSGVTVDKAEALSDHGINSEFVNEIRKAGYTNLSMDDFIDLRDHGVNAAYINDLKTNGAAGLTIEKIIDYRNQGVTGDYLKSFHDAGYSKITVDEALEARNHGVTAAYITGFKKFGFTGISLDKAMELRDHGVTPEFVEKMKAKTGSYFSLDEYIKLKDAGFNSK